jgi:hypothetical protein
MTPEELLIERYKVIAPYPHSPYKVGDIIKPNNGRFVLTQTSHRDEWGETVRTEHLHNIEVAKEYKELFQRLEWWEDRKPEEMPEYVKHKTGKVLKVKEHLISGCKLDGGYWAVYSNLLPATAAEYEAYLQTLTVK